MKTQKLDSFAFRRAALVCAAFAALAVAGCGASTTQLVRQADAQVALTKAAWAEDAKRETERINANANVAIAREKRLAEEAATKRVKYVAMQNIAASSDAGGKAAIATALALERDDGVAQAAPLALAQAAAPVVVPQIPALKTDAELFVDFTKAVLNSPLIGTVGQVALGVVQSRANTDVARINAATQIAQSNNSLAATVSTNGSFVGMGNSIAATAASGNTANVTIANAGLGTAGIIANSGFNAASNASNNAANIATAGFTSNSNIATAGFTSNTNIAASGFNAASGIAANGFAATTAQANTTATLATDLGNNIANTANAGLAAATVLGSRVTNVTTTTVNGNQNAVALQGSTATVKAPTTVTNNCPTTSDANGGNSGTGGPGSNGGNGSPGGSGAGGSGNGGGTTGSGTGASGSGAPGGSGGAGAPGAASGAAGPGTTDSTTNCVAGK